MRGRRARRRRRSWWSGWGSQCWTGTGVRAGCTAIALTVGSEKLANFRIEPPGLFRGRGEHPKMGLHKKRVQPEQITLNIGEGVPVPEPPAGHKWQEVKHDNTVTWIASWHENVQNQVKYVMFNAESRLKVCLACVRY